MKPETSSSPLLNNLDQESLSPGSRWAAIALGAFSLTPLAAQSVPSGSQKKLDATPTSAPAIPGMITIPDDGLADAFKNAARKSNQEQEAAQTPKQKPSSFSEQPLEGVSAPTGFDSIREAHRRFQESSRIAQQSALQSSRHSFRRQLERPPFDEDLARNVQGHIAQAQAIVEANRGSYDLFGASSKEDSDTKANQGTKSKKGETVKESSSLSPTVPAQKMNGSNEGVQPVAYFEPGTEPGQPTKKSAPMTEQQQAFVASRIPNINQDTKNALGQPGFESLSQESSSANGKVERITVSKDPGSSDIIFTRDYSRTEGQGFACEPVKPEISVDSKEALKNPGVSTGVECGTYGIGKEVIKISPDGSARRLDCDVSLGDINYHVTGDPLKKKGSASVEAKLGTLDCEGSYFTSLKKDGLFYNNREMGAKFSVGPQIGAGIEIDPAGNKKITTPKFGYFSGGVFLRDHVIENPNLQPQKIIPPIILP